MTFYIIHLKRLNLALRTQKLKVKGWKKIFHANENQDSRNGYTYTRQKLNKRASLEAHW